MSSIEMMQTVLPDNPFDRRACGVLIAGVGNIFFGDDAFGVEVARRLAQRRLPDGVRAVDFGIRGLDLAYAIMDGCGSVILVDAVARGQPPGTLYVIDPQTGADGQGGPPAALVDAHGMDPARVLRLVRQLGGPEAPIWLVGCEPTPPDDADFTDGLSGPVAAAVDEAVVLVERIVEQVLGRRGPNECLAAARAQ